MLTRSLNVIGCGKVGKTIAYLLRAHNLTSSITLINQTHESSVRAAEFLKDAKVARHINELPPASLWMIATPDAQLASVAQQLASAPALDSSATIFHCSGSTDSSILSPITVKTSNIASLHLIRSFAEPTHAIHSFSGTFCGIEGSAAALSSLQKIFTAIGAQVFEIAPESKMLCHIGHVFASNYLVVLIDCALKLYKEAGIPDTITEQFMRSIIDGTIKNSYALGTTNALTGPVIRGESALIREQLAALRSTYDKKLTHLPELYRTLALGALSIAEEKHTLSDETIRLLKATLEAPASPHIS